MIKKKDIKKIINNYTELYLGVLGSHSALEIMDGAKDEQLKTILIAQKGREKTYKRFNRIVDKFIILNKFNDMLKNDIQAKLLAYNTIIIPHRALTAYLGYDAIENKLSIPIFGNRRLFQAEERSHKKKPILFTRESKNQASNNL